MPLARRSGAKRAIAQNPYNRSSKPPDMASFTDYCARFTTGLAMQWQNLRSSRPVIGDLPLTVSLTTHGPRTALVHLAIESIARNHRRPQRFVLWLDDSARFRNPPAALRRLQRRGLEIRLSRNYGPHTKYYPVVQDRELSKRPLVTADDDILYPRGWLDALHDNHLRQPRLIHCYRARRVDFDDQGFTLYNRWPFARDTEPRLYHFATGVSGVIYPVEFLNQLARAGTGFADCCARADDVWLHLQALRGGFGVRQISEHKQHFLVVPWTRASALHRSNLVAADGETGNDAQIRASYNEADIARLRHELEIHNLATASPTSRIAVEQSEVPGGRATHPLSGSLD